MEKIKSFLQNRTARYIAIGLCVLLCIGILGIVLGALMSTFGAPKGQVLPTVVAYPTQTIVPQATPTPAPVQTLEWEFLSLKEHAIYRNGFWYSLGTFQNVGDPKIIIQAMCMAPAIDAPSPGAIYGQNPWGVLYPVHEPKPLQRFDMNYARK